MPFVSIAAAGRPAAAGSGDADSTRCSRPSSRSRCAPIRYRRPTTGSTRASWRGSSRSSTLVRTGRRGSRKLRGRTSSSPAWRRSTRRRLSSAAALNREVVIWDLKTSNVGPGAVRHRQSAESLRHQPAGRRLLLLSGLPQQRAHDRDGGGRRSLSLAPVAVRDRDRAMRPPSSSGRRRAASSRRAGRSTSRSTRCATCARMLPPKAAGDVALQPRVGEEHRRQLGRPRCRDRRQAGLSRARPPDRRRRLRCGRRARPATAYGACPTARDIYAAALAEATTTNYSADEIHQLGLQQVAEISAELDKILRGAGYTSGTRRGAADRAQQVAGAALPEHGCGPHRAAGEPQCRHGGHGDPASARLPQSAQGAARNPPRSAGDRGRRVERLLSARRARWLAPGDLLHQPQVDRRTGPNIRFRRSPITRAIRAITCRTASRRGRREIPMLRRIAFYSAYGEGWALYAEQVADELGAYKGIERAGYLQSFLFRAERLVVDTGLNSQALDPRAGDRSHGRGDRLRPPARAARGRALLRLAGPGLQLQDRAHRLDSGAREGAAGAREPASTFATSTTF